jgi:hemerythrin-like domain-containing protein
MNATLIQPAPSFDEPLELMSACHGRMADQLETLRRLSAWLPEHGADEQARQAARVILRYFRTAAAHHHEDEEADVFPRLLERVGTADQRQAEGLVSSLLADHRELYAAWDMLRERLEAIEAGSSAELPDRDVQFFTLQYRNHIECEEAMLFPLLRRYFGPADLAELGARMSARRRTG